MRFHCISKLKNKICLFKFHVLVFQLSSNARHEFVRYAKKVVFSHSRIEILNQDYFYCFHKVSFWSCIFRRNNYNYF